MEPKLSILAVFLSTTLVSLGIEVELTEARKRNFSRLEEAIQSWISLEHVQLEFDYLVKLKGMA